MRVHKIIVGIGIALLSSNAWTAEMSDNYDYVGTEIYETPRVGRTGASLSCIKARVAIDKSKTLLENFLSGQRLDSQAEFRNAWFVRVVSEDLALVPQNSILGGCDLSRRGRFIVYGRDVYREINGDRELSYYIVRALFEDQYFDLPVLSYFVATVNQYQIHIGRSISPKEAHELLRETAYLGREEREKWLEDRRRYCLKSGQSEWGLKSWGFIPKRAATNDCMDPVLSILGSISQ